MGKSSVKILLLPAFLLFTGSYIAAQQNSSPRPRVAVTELSNSMGDSYYDALNTAVKKTVLLTLRMMDRYEVIEINSGETSDAPLLAAEKNIDTVITGETVLSHGYACAVRLSVYDKQKNSFVLKKEEKAETILDVFDASEKLVASLLESFSGVHIAYGSVLIDTSGSSGDYRVFLNDMLIGERLSSLPRILTGNYRIDIVQDRKSGKLMLFSGNVEIMENRQAKILIAIPPAGSSEIGEFNSIDSFVFENWHNPGFKKSIEEKLEYGISLSSGNYCEDYVTLNQKYTRMKELFREQAEIARAAASGRYIINRRQAAINEELEKNMSARDLTVQSSAAGNEGNSSFKGRKTLIIDSIRKFRADIEKSGAIPVLPAGSIKPDGRSGDWLGVPVMFSDIAGDAVNNEGGDIRTVRMAMDDKNLYLRFESGDDRITARDSLWYQVYLTVPGGNINFTARENNGQWEAVFSRWEMVSRVSTDLFRGSARAGSNFIECSFPLSGLYRNVEKGKKYYAMAQSGIRSGSRDTIDRGLNLYF